MSNELADAPLLGVVVSPTRIEAQLVEQIPFGRLRLKGNRLVEDVGGSHAARVPSIPLPGAEAEAPHEEERATAAWVDAIAGTVEKLTFGARGGPVRVGLAMDARLDGPGRSVLGARGGPRLEDILDGLEGALHARDIHLFAPLEVAIPLVEALALGEIWSPLGGLAGGVDGVVVMWDQDVGWADVARGEVLRRGVELPGSRLDLGLVRLGRRRIQRYGEGLPLATAARNGDEDVRGLFREAAEILGKGAARRLLAQLSRDSERATVDGEEPHPLRVLLAGACARLAVDPRLEACVLTPFAAGLANGLRGREDTSMEAGLLERHSSGAPTLAPGIVHVGQDASTALVGAAASALRAILPRDERGSRPAKGQQ